MFSIPHPTTWPSPGTFSRCSTGPLCSPGSPAMPSGGERSARCHWGAYCVSAEMGQGNTWSMLATVLVIEDDADLRRLLRKGLEEEGFVVIQASSGSDAVALAESEA